MALLPKDLSFSRQILPVIALLGLVLAIYFIVTGLPDRALSEPGDEPPRAPEELANQARVAGAGIVEPSSEVIDIGTAVPGLVTQVMVEPGDYVTKGQPLFQVDPRAIRARIREADAAIAEARAAIAQARAGLAEARAAEATAERQLALYRNVGDPAAVSRAEVVAAEGAVEAARSRRELARSQLAAAEARLNSARALRGSATTELGRLVVRAPITGEILAVDIRPGEYVSTTGGTSSFIRMGQTRPLHVRIDVDEAEAARVALGELATVSPRGASEVQVKARFVRAEPQIVPKRSLTNSAAERVDVRVLQLIYALPQSASTDTSFRVGQQVDAYIPTRRNGAISAPATEAGAAE